MNAKQLKDSILQYATQGKLVEQSPSDESIEELFEKIQEEKEKLLKSKVIKKEKAATPIVEEEIPFDIPSTWKWARVKDIYYNEGQKKPDMDFCYIDVGSIDNKKGQIASYNVISPEEAPSRARKIVKKGDVIYSTVRPYLQNIAIVEKDFEFETIVSTAFIVMRSIHINNEYLYYVLKSPYFKSSVEDKMLGATYPAINDNNFNNLIIPIPPIQEQKRIVDKIKLLEENVEQYSLVYEQNKEVREKFPIDLEKSILQFAMQGKLVQQNNNEEPVNVLIEKIKSEKEELVKHKIIKKEKDLAKITIEEIPYEIPESWTWVRLGEIGIWKAGSTPSRSNPIFYDGDIPWLKTGELNDGYINSSNEYISQEALNKCSLSLNKPGAVLIAMYGATIGKLGILEIEAATNQACCACHPFSGVYNKYLFYYLMSARSKLRDSAEGGAQPNISRVKIINTLMPLPPLEEQRRIVNKIENVLKTVRNLIDQFDKDEVLMYV